MMYELVETSRVKMGRNPNPKQIAMTLFLAVKCLRKLLDIGTLFWTKDFT